VTKTVTELWLGFIPKPRIVLPEVAFPEEKFFFASPLFDPKPKLLRTTYIASRLVP